MRHTLLISLLLLCGSMPAVAQTVPSPELPQALAAEESQPAPSLELTQSVPPTIELEIPNVGTVSAPLQILILLTFLTFIPAVLVTMTAFTRIVIVFHFLRQALGTQEMPSNQILLGLALFITMFVMAPVAAQVNADALQPVVAGEIGSVRPSAERSHPFGVSCFCIHVRTTSRCLRSWTTPARSQASKSCRCGL